MTFLNDLWKKMKTEGAALQKDALHPDALHASENALKESTEKPHHTPNKETIQNDLKNTLEAFEQTEIESLQRETVTTNLKTLKSIVDEPKEDKPELRFSKIKQHLGEPESHETVRHERWPENIQCPNCKSKRLKRLPQTPPHSPDNHRYQCLDCATTFNDDSDTPFEKGIPPLNIWMQCWYLMGCTDSLNYIAAKLNLDIALVEFMTRELKKIFNAQKPLTRFLDFEEWSKQSVRLREQLKEDLLKQYERLNANVATAPKDTAEFRRQQNIRRGLSPTAPPSPTLGKKR